MSATQPGQDFGANDWLVEEMYERYQSDPSSVTAEWIEFFKTYSPTTAGSVTAALYLEHFVGDARWVHLDIAGPARSESDAGENVKGGTGFGVRLLLDWIVSLS